MSSVTGRSLSTGELGTGGDNGVSLGALPSEALQPQTKVGQPLTAQYSNLLALNPDSSEQPYSLVDAKSLADRVVSSWANKSTTKPNSIERLVYFYDVNQPNGGTIFQYLSRLINKALAHSSSPIKDWTQLLSSSGKNKLMQLIKLGAQIQVTANHRITPKSPTQQQPSRSVPDIVIPVGTKRVVVDNEFFTQQYQSTGLGDDVVIDVSLRDQLFRIPKGIFGSNERLLEWKFFSTAKQPGFDYKKKWSLNHLFPGTDWLKKLGVTLEWESNAGMRWINNQLIATNGGGAFKIAFRNPKFKWANLVIGFQFPEGRVPIQEILPRIKALLLVINSQEKLSDKVYQSKLNQALNAVLLPTFKSGGQFSLVYNFNAVLFSTLSTAGVIYPFLKMLALFLQGLEKIAGTNLRGGFSVSSRNSSSYTAKDTDGNGVTNSFNELRDSQGNVLATTEINWLRRFVGDRPLDPMLSEYAQVLMKRGFNPMQVAGLVQVRKLLGKPDPSVSFNPRERGEKLSSSALAAADQLYDALNVLRSHLLPNQLGNEPRFYDTYAEAVQGLQRIFVILHRLDSADSGQRVTLLTRLLRNPQQVDYGSTEVRAENKARYGNKKPDAQLMHSLLQQNTSRYTVKALNDSREPEQFYLRADPQRMRSAINFYRDYQGHLRVGLVDLDAAEAPQGATFRL